VCLITHINLNYFIFGWRFALFKMPFPLKLKLLGPWICVEWLNVFVLLRLTDRCHVGKELFEDLPPHWYQSPNWTSLLVAMVGTRQTLILTEEAEWHILTPCMCGQNSWLVFLRYEELQRYAPPFTKIQTIITVQAVTHSFHHAMCWPRVMKELRGVPSRRPIPWMSWPELGFCRI